MEVKVIRDVMLPIADYYDVPATMSVEQIKQRLIQQDLNDFFYDRDLFRYTDSLIEIGNVELDIPELGIHASETKIEESIFEKIANKLKSYGVSDEIIKDSVFIY